ncbi:pirin family protein [Paraglaciecola polaris]|uniref:Pirin-like protein CC_3178 n=1 Tax=Paraglaciecola polaris LMG 21857 TaxID=1129793 RepID=K7ACM5_9ALTE|nr:pirin family protein [Paraglaciecola polaris]GAC33110.1 pirin-like protein CC_3178 [Paraglaciecola polaris LMG 21857]|tara:strand:+ start:6500 stop:7414 length:915 start_codon:yes stop_codon:yes gene_type:complete
MSIESKDLELECNIDKGCDAIDIIIQPRAKDLGEFSVRRTLPTKERKTVGPWIFFDHMGPANFPAGSGINVRPHPHINLATVTYLFEGEILHRDSLGSYATITPGDINLMVAGKGITHSERERPEVKNVEHTLHGLQLWLALPEKDEEIDPAFYHYSSTIIPGTTIEGVSLRVLMGSAYGLTSPVLTYAETLYVEAHMQAGQILALPNCEERAIYVAKGSLKIKDTVIPEFAMVVLSAAEGVMIEATTECRIALIGGEKMAKRYIEWNFISSRKERVEQAKQDWLAGRFPKVVGDEHEFIPLPK